MASKSNVIAVTAIVFLVGCKQEPPALSITGPETVSAGKEAQVSATVSPWKKGMRVQWRAKWARSQPGQRECDVELNPEDETKAKLRVSEACGGGKVLVTAIVSGTGPETKASYGVEIVPKEEPVWPEPLPDGWHILNDYASEGALRTNKFGAASGTWGFKGGKCKTEVVDGALKLTYIFPLGDSECGTYEYFKGQAGKPEPFDISAYEKIAVLMRSGDGKEHRLTLEIVELDPYAEALQGYVASSPTWTVGSEWRRFEVRLEDTLHPRFNRKMGKQLGLRLRRQDQQGDSGVVLVDKIALIEKVRK